jgi:hypothetical protein
MWKIGREMVGDVANARVGLIDARLATSHGSLEAL